MLTTKEIEQRKQIKYLCIEDLVPQDHLLRKVESLVDFSFIRDEVKDLYCLDNGRPSIDPVVLFKLVLINYMYGLNSMRRTIRESEVNTAYRWFLGYDLLERLPHFTTFGKNYKRRFEGTDIFETIFERILSIAIDRNLLDTEAIFIDGTHIKANANTHKNYKVAVQKEAKHYNKQLLKEINSDREIMGRAPYDDDDFPPETKTITQSKTDPESGLFHKGEHKKCFAYNAQTACDKHNFILGVSIEKGNVHDSVAFDGLYNKIKDKFDIKAVVMDVGYKTPFIAKTIFDDNKIPVLPYKRPMTKQGYFKKYEYVYDEYYDEFICPNNKLLTYATTNKEGYREYKSYKCDCAVCPHKMQCTASAEKVICRHVWEGYLEEAEHIRHTDYGKRLYSLRSETIERVFADAKEKHGLRYARHLGKAKVKAQVLMTFTCMNLKKILKMLGKLPSKLLRKLRLLFNCNYRNNIFA